MVVGEAMITAGIGSRKGVSVAQVIAAVETALDTHGLAVGALSALATTAFKREEEAIFAAGRELGLPVVVVGDGNSDGNFALRQDQVLSANSIAGDSSSTLTTSSPLWGGIEGGGQQHSDRRRDDTPLRGPDSAVIPPPSIPPHKGEGGIDAAPYDTCDSRAPGRKNEDTSTLTHSARSLALAGTPSVSETAALAAAGKGARLLGSRIVVGPVTCALATSGDAA
jgi:cobalt-precorrin 5A hydrolase